MIHEKQLMEKVVEAATKQRWQNIEPRNWFHCSGAGTCRRQLWNAKNGKYELSSKSVLAMNVGTIIHKWMEDNLELGPAFRKEVQVSKVYGDIVVVGKCDMFDEDTVYDFKTIRALWYLPKVDPANKHSAVTFYRHHVPQLNMYADIVGRDNISIIYVDKGSLELKQFSMKADKLVVEEAVKKFHDVAKVMDATKNPFDFCGCFVCKEEEKKKENSEWKRV